MLAGIVTLSQVLAIGEMSAPSTKTTAFQPPFPGRHVSAERLFRCDTTGDDDNRGQRQQAQTSFCMPDLGADSVQKASEVKTKVVHRVALGTLHMFHTVHRLTGRR